MVDRSLWIHRRSNSKQISKDFLESGSLRPNYKTCNFTLSRPWCSSEIEVSANTVSGVVLGDVPEVFTHPFTQCSFYMSNVLSETYLTGDAVIGLLMDPEVYNLAQYLQLFLEQKLHLQLRGGFSTNISLTFMGRLNPCFKIIEGCEAMLPDDKYVIYKPYPQKWLLVNTITCVCVCVCVCVLLNHLCIYYK